MKRTGLYALAILLAYPLLAQTTGTAAVAADQPGFFSWANLQKILEYGGVVFVAIMGMKNVPFFADFFQAWPKLSVITNAVLSLITAWILCLKMPGHDSAFYICLATAAGIFLSAAGLHLVVAKVSPDSSSPAVNPARVEKLKQ